MLDLDLKLEGPERQRPSRSTWSGQRPPSSKSLSLDLDSSSTALTITLDRDSLELKSLSHSSRLFYYFLHHVDFHSLAWSAVSLRLLCHCKALFTNQTWKCLHTVFKCWSFYETFSSRGINLYYASFLKWYLTLHKRMSWDYFSSNMSLNL